MINRGLATMDRHVACVCKHDLNHLTAIRRLVRMRSRSILVSRWEGLEKLYSVTSCSTFSQQALQICRDVSLDLS